MRVAIAVLALAGVLASSASAAKPPPLTLNVPLPAPGHVSIETFRLTVPSKAFPVRLALRPLDASSLPPSVRVIYGRRSIRSGSSTTYALVLLVINRAPGRSLARSHVDQLPMFTGEDMSFAADLALFFGSPAAAAYLKEEATVHVATGKPVPQATRAKATLAANADLASAAQAKQAFSAFKALEFDANGELDPGVETGHYDDGHAFGWKGSAAAERKALGDLSDLGRANTDALIADIERDLRADINGDGKIGTPAPSTPPTTGGGMSGSWSDVDTCSSGCTGSFAQTWTLTGGASFTGHGSDDSGHSIAITGTLAGATLTMHEAYNNGYTADFKGTLAGDGKSVSGTWTDSEGKSGTFQASHA